MNKKMVPLYVKINGTRIVSKSTLDLYMAAAHKSIYSALIANLLIAVTKFIAGAISNSSAMISEGVHSLVDTINQILLLFGIKRSQRPPDKIKPFGYGKELYFWSFIVSILIFGFGGGVSVYQGIVHIIEPEKLGDPTWNYAVLGASLVFEGISLTIAIKEFNSGRGELSWWEAIKESKDPSAFLVLFEDSAAVLGLIMVGVFVFLSHQLNIPQLDGVGSLLVGILLLIVSSLLARESRSLLMGEGISAETQKKIKVLAEKDPAVLKVISIISTYQSPEEVLLMLIIAFKADLNTEDINDAITRIRNDIREEFTLVRFVIIQPEVIKS
jgi:cation diffusion facilitator family transporter